MRKVWQEWASKTPRPVLEQGLEKVTSSNVDEFLAAIREIRYKIVEVEQGVPTVGGIEAPRVVLAGPSAVLNAEDAGSFLATRMGLLTFAMSTKTLIVPVDASVVGRLPVGESQKREQRIKVGDIVQIDIGKMGIFNPFEGEVEHVDGDEIMVIGDDGEQHFSSMRDAELLRRESKKHEDFEGTDFSAIERAALKRIKETYRIGEMDMNLIVDLISSFWSGGMMLDDFTDKLFQQLGGGAAVGNITRELEDAGIL